MAELDRRIQWRLQPGAYLGEISALSFLHIPSHLSSLPLLLAGTGSELLVYDIKSGGLLKSFRVFQGVRVHGISVRSVDQKDASCLTVAFLIAVFGERRLKLFELRYDERRIVDLELVGQLPRFDHWVLDACFLKGDNYLAVGLSDNSVALWDMNMPKAVLRVKYTDRSLLYSLRIWGDSIDDLHVASGTIYNEIIVWKLSHQILLPSSAYLIDSMIQCTSGHNKIHIHGEQYVPIHVSRLSGHEGSIFRIAWSADGSRLMSVSDDRSARIWRISGLNQARGDVVENHGCHLSVDLVLFGHNARIWDCHISDSIVITAGEDCTCRVWGTDGKHLSTIKEHIGRGIWRCLYDPGSSLLITAGFDSAIKVHLLQSSSWREMSVHSGVSRELKNPTEIFTICAPKVSNLTGLMDSKSEYVRCVRFARENILYVATNNGYLYHVQLRHPDDAIWTEVAQVSKEAPIICMDLISTKSSVAAEDTMAVGDGKGNVTVISVVNGDSTPKFSVSCTWSAEKERQLLGVYWCKSLGCTHLFTADPRGVLKLWNIGVILQSDTDNASTDRACPVAVFMSSFNARIICLDVSVKDEVLICGDQRGNLTMYPFSKSLLIVNSSKIAEKVPLLGQFKGAHGISSITSVLIATWNLYDVEVCTTGGDGCICYFKYNKNVHKLEFIGMKQVKELSTVQSFPTKSTSEGRVAYGNYAVGFMSADFIIWNLTNESKTVQVPCGGWRRPHSYHLGDIPEYQNCFAYLKDNDIHIHRLWIPVQGRELICKVLHVQYHGRETHSLCFISPGMQSNLAISCYSCFATGCEDGTVRLTRYTKFDTGSWCESKLLGEHVGGSAVRSIYFVSKIHTIPASETWASHRNLADRKVDQLLLISVGAKQVLTSWLLQPMSTDIENEQLNSANTDSDCMSSPLSGFSSISFQWLSTHMPPKFASAHQKVKSILATTTKGNSSTVQSTLSESNLVGTEKQNPKPDIVDQHENDWRYMAVTAFLVKRADSRLTICFVAVACSDSTLMLRALLLPYRLWIDVAALVSHASPVLALQHLVIPSSVQSKDNVGTGNVYIVISGSTDGCITFWDLTETIGDFMQTTLDLRLDMLVDGQKRPQTGRGSQGGRWWRSLKHQPAQKGDRISSSRSEVGNNTKDQCIENVSVDASFSRRHDSANGPTSGFQKRTSLSHPEIREIWPLHVLKSVHLSGVNCLHVSERKDNSQSSSEASYCILSGGDDQAVHCIAFALTQETTSPGPCIGQQADNTNQVQDWARRRESGSALTEKRSSRNLHSQDQLRVLYRDRVDSAHSSAVKGIWTDGVWAFSTGLDQRIRCWKIGPGGKLTEHAHLIVSVPEPEALDAISCDSTNQRYQIAVAGRGMQVAEFYASINDDCDL